MITSDSALFGELLKSRALWAEPGGRPAILTLRFDFMRLPPTCTGDDQWPWIKLPGFWEVWHLRLLSRVSECQCVESTFAQLPFRFEEHVLEGVCVNRILEQESLLVAGDTDIALRHGAEDSEIFSLRHGTQLHCRITSNPGRVGKRSCF